MSLLPLPSTQAPMVSVVGANGKPIGKGFIIPPWNNYFSQFSGTPNPFDTIAVTPSPFSYTASNNGTVYVIGGTGVTLFFNRSNLFFGMLANPNLNTIVLRSGDVFAMIYAVAPTIQFVPD